jgi:pimeloyl-ACP methyl ester carboxylesterase
MDTDILAPEVARRMVETIPNAQLVEVPRAGHMVFEDNPEGFLAALRGFLG